MSTKNSYNIVKYVDLRLVKEEAFRNYCSDVINSQYDVVDVMKRYIKDKAVEEVYILGCDNRNRLSVISNVAVGTPTSCPLPVGTILKTLLLANCTSGILIHNHCSGDSMEFSKADIEATRKVSEALKLVDITLNDHVLVNSDCSSSKSMRTADIYPSIW